MTSSPPADAPAPQDPGHVQDRVQDSEAVRLGAGGPWLKWHKLRRHGGDMPFDRANLHRGLAVGARLEVDITLLEDATFACLHDATLDAETSGSGPAAAVDRAGLARLKQRGEDGALADTAPLGLDELVALVARAIADASPAPHVQLDLKTNAGAITPAATRAFATLVGPLARAFILTGLEADAVLRLAGGLGGLALGYDPARAFTRADAASKSALSTFLERAAATIPEAALIYLPARLVLAALDAGIDVAALFRNRGMGVDAWTIDVAAAADMAPVRRLKEAGVEQITTNTPLAMAALAKAGDNAGA